MRKYIFLFLLFPMLVFGQKFTLDKLLFPAAIDTISDYAAQDTVQLRGAMAGGAISPWKTLTQTLNDTAFITVDDKLAETTVVFNVSSESWWTWFSRVQIRIVGQAETLNGNWIPVGGLEGAITIFIIPDTLLADTETDYGASKIGGN